MSGTSDRIRRILSDAGASLKRASELPPVGTGPAPEVRPETARLLERLRALRAGQRTTPREAVDGSSDAFAPLVLPEEDDDDRPLAERVGGVLRSGPLGSFLFVEKRWPLASTHGHVLLADVPEHLLPLRKRERRPGSITHVDPRTAVYLDVETTGLAGGTGTVAFLVGAGRVEGDAFVVRQYFVRDFPDEPAVLAALADDLGDAALVTFNGRTFDWPLLTTRWRIHRTPVADRDHVDLLPPSRQLWAGSLASHALGQLERHVLGVVRTRDLPGALIPSAYFAWLREAKATAMTMAFHHNEVDIVSLAALGAVIGRLLRDPSQRPGAPASDHLGTAKLLVNQGELGKAKACLEAAVAGGCDDGSPALLRLLGRLHRQAGDLEAAARTWERWRREGPGFDAHPYEELAKLLEHRRRNLPAALETVEDALVRCPRGDGRREGPRAPGGAPASPPVQGPPPRANEPMTQAHASDPSGKDPPAGADTAAAPASGAAPRPTPPQSAVSISVDAWLRRRRIAVCGATPKHDRWGYRVFRRLLDEGYDVIPVHPIAPHVDQIPCYASLTEIPGGVDAVSVITPPSASLDVVRAAAEIGSPPCWFQPGASSDEVLAEAARLGVATIDGPCVLIELDRRGGRPRGTT